MPNVAHSTLTGSDLHEPKGVSTANAGNVYIANGSGSGVWTPWPSGWGFYADNGSAQGFNTTAAKLTCDGAASNSDSSYLPRIIRGSGELWDTTNNKITPIALGDSYSIRVTLPVTAKTGSPNEVTFEIDIGGGASPSTVIVTRDIATTGATPFTLNIGIPLFVSSTSFANGFQFFLSVDTGTITVTNPDVLVVRTHAGTI